MPNLKKPAFKGRGVPVSITGKAPSFSDIQATTAAAKLLAEETGQPVVTSMQKNKRANPPAQTITNKDAYVHIEKSVTKNMGDYQSARVTVGVCLPLNYTQEDLDNAQKNIEVQMQLVDTVIAEQVEVLMEPGVTEEWIDNLTRSRKTT